MKTQAAIILVAFLIWGTDSASFRSILPQLALNDDLAAELNSAENSVSSHVTTDLRRRNMNPVKIDELNFEDVFFQVDRYTSVELTEVMLNNAPAVSINSVKPNLEFLTMGVDVNIEALEIVGSFKIVNENILIDTPIVTSGHFSMSIADIHASGKVGLTMNADSFSTMNYDVEYEKKKDNITTRYFNGDGTDMSSSDDEGDMIAEKLNNQLDYLLNQILKANLDQALSELSVNQLIGNPRLRSDYTEHVNQLKALANTAVDEIIKAAKEFIEKNNYQQQSLPNIEASIVGVKFKAQSGYIRNLASLKRTGDISLEFDVLTGQIVVFGSLGLSEMQLGYNHYSLKFLFIGISGTLRGTVGQNSVFLKAGFTIGANSKIDLKSLYIEYARNINIQVTGLGIFNWLFSNIATMVVAAANSRIVNSLNGAIFNYVNSVLANIEPNEFFGLNMHEHLM